MNEIARQCKHYTGRGVMKLYESGAALAQDMGVPVSKVEDSIEAHYQASLKTEPDGGLHPASPSGKSWDEASGEIGSGEKFHHNVISGADLHHSPISSLQWSTAAWAAWKFGERFGSRFPASSLMEVYAVTTDSAATLFWIVWFSVAWRA